MEEDLRRAILGFLESRGAASFEEIEEHLKWLGDKRRLRMVLASMVREGILAKRPDYERRKMVFELASRGGRGGEGGQKHLMY